MKKKVAIIDYSEQEIAPIYNQLKSIFNDAIDIIKIVQGDEVEKKVSVDILLYPSFSLYKSMRNYFHGHENAIKMNKTITLDSKERLKQVKVHGPVYSYHKDFSIASEISREFHHMLNCNKVNIAPISNISSENERKIYIVLEDSYKEKKYGHEQKFINLGPGYLDVDTIVEMSMKLDLDYITENINLYNTNKSLATTKEGLKYIINKMNSYQSKVKVLLDSNEDGIIELGKDGDLKLCNNNACRIMNTTREELLKMKAKDYLPGKLIEEAFVYKNTVKNEVAKIHDKDIIFSIEPVIHSGRFYGAIIILKEFHEVENRQHKIRKKLIGKGHKAKYTFDNLIGDSQCMLECKKIAKRMSMSKASILITGETGTGKEIFAQAIHNESPRKNYQFVAVNCGALPANILESELFGYEDGAFTGSRKGGKMGLFELAHKGTIFLDEIGEMPYILQTKLLRVLQEKEIMRLGSDKIISVDIRVIAATNRKLEEQIAKKRFREDLYYRLNVLPLHIPPIRNRREDILPLIEYYKKSLGGDFLLSDEAKKVLVSYKWNGNVREIVNFVEYSCNINEDTITANDIIFNNKNEEELKRENSKAEEDFLESIGEDLEKYIFVLKVLNESYEKKVRVGRRSIYEKTKEVDLLLGEQEIRKILINLNKNGLVKISKGRLGSVITEYGKEILKVIDNS
ncbi:sigma-54 interaction domain-containing protein [Oceanirhabdus seepicola]|uniref:Sigma 54-interacting transcriptional regulator n=1 Tax=Oceanirhabdus seepicola TaxID=2828781 RepID=A0A9J6NZU6_9CLOT|nr:sigma 54-interacting transcriptional regulator [Oceanirhabdus seepicola]MCM1989409.1 sigma 54-interacting transcriptional regulator [Oceanirhabdus seepicola]